MQFNQAIPATWALSLGDALETIMLDSERSRLFYEIAAKNAIAEGAAARSSANAIQDSYDKQADATRDGAWGDIFNAGSNLAGEGFAIGMSSRLNSQLSEAEAQQSILNRNKEFIDETARNNQVRLQAENLNAPGAPLEHVDLHSMNLKTAFDARQEGNIQAAALADRPAFNRLQERAANEQAALDKQIDSLHRQKESVGQNMRNRSMIAGNIAKSGWQMQVASDQHAQAEAQKMQTLLSFSAELLKSIQQMLQQSANSLSDQMLGKAHALIGAIAESNRA